MRLHRAGVLLAVGMLTAPPTTLYGASSAAAGSEFQVNTYTSGAQSHPAVASDPAGNFMLVWESDGQDGSYSGIFGQRFSSTGSAIGTEFQVNTFTPNRQRFPAIAADGNGNFVVVWMSYAQEGGNLPPGIFGKRYTSTGAAMGTEFHVNTYTNGRQAYPAVAADPAGDFVVVWESYGQLGGMYGYGVFERHYTSMGVPLTNEIQVGHYNVEGQRFPAVAMDGAGNFVVAWERRYGDIDDILAQRFDKSGVPRADVFRVNAYTTGAQSLPAVASDAAGDFVIVWQSAGQDSPNPNSTALVAKRYSSVGAAVGSEFVVNSYTSGDQGTAAVAADANGNVVVVWRSAAQDGSGGGIVAQRYDSLGATVGAEFAVNTYTTGDQLSPAVALDSQHGFVVTWTSVQQDGDQSGVFGQRFNAPLTPAAETPTSTPTSTQTAPSPTSTHTQTPTPTAVPTDTPTPVCPTDRCVGDCNGNQRVTVDEVLTGVNIALQRVTLDRCPAFDGNCDHKVTIDEILAAVNAALSRCPNAEQSR